MPKFDWDKYKDEIERLYITENRSLSDVMSILKSSRNFNPSKAQYQRKLEDWNFRKHLTAKKWAAIAYKVEKKSQNGRKSVNVYINGTLCPSPKVRKETARQGFMSTASRAFAPKGRSFTEGLEGLFVTSNQTSVAAGQGIPYNQGTSLRISSSRLPDWVIAAMSPQKGDAQRQLYHNDQAQPDSMEPHMAQFFLLANNFRLEDKYTEYETLDEFRPHDGRVLALIHSAGLHKPGQFQRLLSLKSPMTDALSAQFFASALRSQNLNLLELMAKAGMNLDTLVDAPDPILYEPVSYVNLGWDPPKYYDGVLLPLEFAASLKEEAAALRLSDFLLAHKATLNREVSRPGQLPALGIAIKRRHLMLVTRFIDKGARVLEKFLPLARETNDYQLTRMIKQALGMPADLTALGVAVKAGDILHVRQLITAGAILESAEICSLDDVEWITTTPLGLAARDNNLQAIRVLVEAGAACNPSLEIHACPLPLAMIRKHYDAARILIDFGATLPAAYENMRKPVFSPDHKIRLNACFMHRVDFETIDDDLCDILLSTASCFKWHSQGNYWCRDPDRHLLDAINADNVFAISRILRQNPMLCQHEWPGSSVNIATHVIGVCQIETVRAVLLNGEVFPRDIHRIASPEVMDILERSGILDQIPQNKWSSIFAIAMLEEQVGVSRRILDLIDITTCPPIDTPSPLDVAIATRDINLANSLIGEGVSISENALDSAVWESLRSGNYLMLWFVVNAVSEETTPRIPEYMDCGKAICMAMGANNFELLELLLNLGCKPKVQSCLDDEELFQELSNFQCHQQRSEMAQLHWSRWNKFWRTRADNRHATVLDIAVKLGQHGMLRMLLDRVVWESREIGHALVTAVLGGKDYMISDLLRAGADVNATTYTTSALRIAIGRQDLQLVQTFLHGANINSFVNLDVAMLRTAVRAANVTLVDTLLEAGAKVVDYSCGRYVKTPLWDAAANGCLVIADRLIEAGSDVNACDGCPGGQTALQAAAGNGRIHMLQFLLRRGAKLDGPGYRTRFVRAVQLADTNGHQSSAGILKSHGGWTDEDASLFDRYQEDLRSYYLGTAPEALCDECNAIAIKPNVAQFL
ncbi:hypothetical protein QQS21_002259 [Conoideocrella luteorostrata]|uniref:Clr5 domain-containing protein n=1 Tax=Conoideocrella luteorostrata TaxID=1105319 RepID=A0AAJ0CZJ9_9HYPO|nr:hypothetical protein QQS21_002259 [Conoideocrella luteorostrata]